MSNQNRIKLTGPQSQRLRRLLHMEYSPHELAAEIECAPGTILTAIADGCPHRVTETQTWIVGDSFATWYHGQKRRAPETLAPGDAYCVTCRAARRPINLRAPQPNSPGVVRILGECPECGHTVALFQSAKPLEVAS